MQEVLVIISQLLSKLRIRYCLVGGLAVAIHGIPRFTDDIDFLVESHIKDVREAIEQFAAERGGLYRYVRAEPDDPLGDVLQLTIAGVHVDLLIAKWPYELDALMKAKPERFREIEVLVIEPEPLILMKLHTGGPQDLYDIAGILRVRADQLNEARIIKSITGSYLMEKWELAKRLAAETGGG